MFHQHEYGAFVIQHAHCGCEHNLERTIKESVPNDMKNKGNKIFSQKTYQSELGKSHQTGKPVQAEFDLK